MDKMGKKIADLRTSDLCRRQKLFHDNAARIYRI